MQKVDEKEEEIERKPCIPCKSKKCDNNLFGYCQISPNIDEEGKCSLFKERKS